MSFNTYILRIKSRNLWGRWGGGGGGRVRKDQKDWLLQGHTAGKWQNWNSNTDLTSHDRELQIHYENPCTFPKYIIKGAFYNVQSKAAEWYFVTLRNFCSLQKDLIHIQEKPGQSMTVVSSCSSLNYNRESTCQCSSRKEVRLGLFHWSQFTPGMAKSALKASENRASYHPPGHHAD